MKRENEELKARVRDLESSSAAHLKRAKELEVLNSSLGLENAALKGKVDELEKAASASSSRLRNGSQAEADLRSLVEKLRGDLAQTKEQLEEKSSEYELLRNERDTSNSREGDESEQRQKPKKGKKPSEYLQLEIEDMMARLTKTRSELERSKEECLKEKMRASEMKFSLDSSELAMKEAQKQAEKYKQQSLESKSDREKQEQLIKQLHKELAELQHDKSKFIEQESKLKTQFTETEGRLKAQLVEIESRNKAHQIETENVLKFQVDYLTREVRSKDDKIDELTHKLLQIKSKRPNLDSSIRVLDTSASAMQESFLTRVVEDLRNQVRELKNERMGDKADRYPGSNRDINDLVAKLNLLEAKYSSDKESGSRP